MSEHRLIFLKKSQIFAFYVCSPVAYFKGWNSHQIKSALDDLNKQGIIGDKAGTRLRYRLVKELEASQ